MYSCAVSLFLVGVKRSSPLAPHQQPSRPAKLAHFDQQPLAHAHQHLYVNSNGVSGLPPPAHDATTPSPTPSSSSSSCGRRSKLLVEPPLLMSPEINSLMGDERPLQLSTSHQQLHHHQQKPHQQQLRGSHQSGHSITPTIVGGQRSNAADDGKPFVCQDLVTTTHTRAFHAPHAPHAPLAPPAHAQCHQLHHYQTRLATQWVAQDLTTKNRRSTVSASSDDDSDTESVSSSSSSSTSSSSASS